MFSPERAFPLDKIRQNPYTAMVVTRYGGHISFCEGLLPTGCNYSCRILKEYLQQVLGEIANDKTTTTNQFMGSSNQLNSRAVFDIQTD